MDNIGHLLGGQIGRGKFLATVAVKLDIDQPGRYPGPVVRVGRGCCLRNSGDFSPFNIQANRFTRIVASAEQLHGYPPFLTYLHFLKKRHIGLYERAKTRSGFVLSCHLLPATVIPASLLKNHHPMAAYSVLNLKLDQMRLRRICPNL